MKTISDFKPFDIFANRLHHKSLTNFTQHYQLNCFNVLQKQFHCPKINKKKVRNVFNVLNDVWSSTISYVLLDSIIKDTLKPIFASIRTASESRKSWTPHK